MTKKLRPKIDKKDLHTIWARLVKDRDGWTCQLCGRDLAKIGGRANAHHIAGKATTLLRFSLDNGVCLCQGCHKFGVHSPDGFIALSSITRLQTVIGKERWDRIEAMKATTEKQPLIVAQEQLLELVDGMDKVKQEMDGNERV